jgi:3-dehydroquinate synthase
MTTTDAVTTITVGGPAPYDVIVGPGVSTAIEPFLGAAATCAVVHADALAKQAGAVVDAVGRSGVRVVSIPVPAGEGGKALDVLAAIWARLATAGVTRTDVVVSVGGGATTDVVGFAAATWLRGVRVVHVPTTLLAMVDAAVGGKTAINTTAGKNLVGAFHPPAGVLVDLDLLASLPQSEWVNGMAEVVKAGFIADPVILDLVTADPDGARRCDGKHSRELIERSIRMKAGVVSADLKEAGPREMLNYGHTLGHAIERVRDYAVPHGHAVAVGMVFAAELARAAGRLDPDVVARHRELIGTVGLPTSHDGDDWPALRAAMQVDKKSRGARLRFVVLEDIGRPVILDDPDEGLLEEAFAAVST